jgi:hypothetical protein
VELSGTLQLLAYADDVDLPGDNIDSMKKNTETLNEAREEVCLEINVEKTKHVLLSRHQNACENRDIKITKKMVWKCVTVHIFGKDSNKSKFDSGGN